jgi:hypothetical protein
MKVSKLAAKGHEAVEASPSSTLELVSTRRRKEVDLLPESKSTGTEMLGELTLDPPLIARTNAVSAEWS